MGPLFIVGHRGAAGLAPENTLASFRAAMECGADWVELDVRFSLDGVPVVIHDPKLDRTTDGAGWVRDHTAAEIGTLDAGRWFGAAFHGERVPLLAEALAVMSGRAGVNIEIKETGDGLERSLGQVLRDTGHSGLQPFLISSFSPEVVARAAALGAPAGLLVPPRTRQAPAMALRLGAGTVIFSTRQASAARLAAARSLGLPAWVYTVNDRKAFRRAEAMGAQGVIGDRPDLLRSWRDAP